LKRAYFTTVKDGVFCVGRVCYKQTRSAFAFQPSRIHAWLEWDYGRL